MVILVLDFDKTITDIHSQGTPDVQIFLWNEMKNYHRLILCLDFIHKKNCKIYVVSRSNKKALEKYLRAFSLTFFISGIYGADEINPITFPSESVDKAVLRWSTLKVKFIEKITTELGIGKNDVYFVDDTRQNIEYALNSGFTNSILCENGSIGLCKILSEKF